MNKCISDRVIDWFGGKNNLIRAENGCIGFGGRQGACMRRGRVEKRPN